MDFTEAEQKRNHLLAQLSSRQITPDQFAAGINALRVTDSSGRTWQPAPSPSGWLCWNGTSWQPATPSGERQAGQPSQKPAKDFNEFKSSLMTVDEFRKVSKDVPLAKRPQKWWDLLSILGGIAAAVLWFLYGSVRSGREGFDLITPLLMIGIPVILVWFRADFDRMLEPLQPHRKKISKILLIGLGIAIPFLTAWILYNIFNISQYPLMQANMVVGTFAAYAITRDPQPGIVISRKGPVPATAIILFAIMLCSCVIAPVLADDCERDPLNAQDCLRTDGYAEGMAGLIATILSILINGPIIAQTLLQGATGAAGAGAGVQQPVTPEPPTAPQGPFVGDKTTFVDGRGVTRTAVLQPDGHWLTDEGTWYDPDYDKFLADQKVKDAEIAAWKAKAEAESAAAQAAIDAAKKLKAMSQGIDPVTGKKILTPEQQRRRDLIGKQRDAAADEAAGWSEYGSYLDSVVNKLEWIKWGCDKSIDVLSQVTGPAGKTIAKVYKVGTNVGEGLGEGMAEGGNYAKHIGKGVLKAGVDLAGDALVDKGFGKLGEKLGTQGKTGQVVDWLNREIKVNPDPLAMRMFGSNKAEIAGRAFGNAGKGWLKGWGPSYGTDAIKDVIGK
ncbi:MAG TPA: hypothetical protein P5013_00360 [Methanoregula sp.]|nr:hypothetical protein [Methanoregula sp.]